MVKKKFFLLFISFFIIKICHSGEKMNKDIWDFLNNLTVVKIATNSFEEFFPYPLKISKSQLNSIEYEANELKLKNDVTIKKILLLKDTKNNPLGVTLYFEGKCIILKDIQKNFPGLKLSSLPTDNYPDSVSTYFLQKKDRRVLFFVNFHTNCLSSTIFQLDKPDLD